MLDSFSLDGKIILLTGATGHLGRSMAVSIVDAGGILILNARNEMNLKKFVSCIHAKSDRLHIFSGDITDPLVRKALTKTIADKYGILHGIVNNASSGVTGTIQSTTSDEALHAFRVNMEAPFFLIQSLLPFLKHANGASIVNIASMYGMVSPDADIYGDTGQNNPPFYGATKAGLIQLTRYLACHLARDGIRVNSISPGPFPREKVKKDNPDFYQELCKKTPLGRGGWPEELTGSVQFLLSAASTYINGVNLPVDGGWTAW